MPTIVELAQYIAFTGIGFVLCEITYRKNKAVNQFLQHVKKKRPIIFLETENAVYYRPLIKTVKGLGITPNKEIILLTPGSIKPCANLGNVQIGHGDLYKSLTVPQELRQFIHERSKDKWTEEEIATFLQEIEQIPDKQLKKRFKILKTAELRPETVQVIKKQKFDDEGKPVYDKDNNPVLEETVIGEKVNEKDKKKYDIYLALPSVVKNFIYTGLNRVSIHAMIQEMVYQRDLEKMGKRNWVNIGIAILVIAVGIGFMIRFIFGTPGMMDAIVNIIGPKRVAP